MRLSAFIILLTLLSQIKCPFTFQLIVSHPKSYFECIKPTVNNRVIIYLLYFVYDINPDYLMSVKNAHEAGLEIQLQIFPTRCREPEEQISFLMESFKDYNVGRYWLYLHSTMGTQKCSWKHYSPEENCKYLVKLLAEAEKAGLKMGIFIYITMWMDIFKDRAACPEVSTVPLWFGEYNQDYVQIGGWKAPYMQTLTDTKLCGDYIRVNKVITELESQKLIQ